MKIIGKTLDGDLIIQVSQAEWDGLGDGIRPKDHEPMGYRQAREEWLKTDANKLLGKHFHGKAGLMYAFGRGEIDGSIQSLRDVAEGKIIIPRTDSDRRWRLKKKLETLLDNHTTQSEEKQ